MKVIENIFINYEGYKDSYINNLNFRVDDNLNIYTDASKNKDNHNSIGWVVINSQVIELELLAILAALMMVKENSKVNIYTDNMGVVELSWSIKSHSNNLGNDLADGLCKAALLDKDGSINSEININNDYTWEYSVFWKNTIVKSNPREFMKNINQLKYKRIG
ncbi:hypothetical protein RhiirB3_455038 [Rhizophagus irregularis]|nr:hypothetical protein RhiirB3_455038 [Rhizophagus irregularis]